MSKKVKAGIVLGVVAAVLLAGGIYFWPKPMFTPENNPRVSFISVTQGIDGVTYSADIPKEAIPDKLNDALISLLSGAEIRHSLAYRPQSYPITDDTVYIETRVVLDGAESSSVVVQLSTVPEFNCANFASGTKYHIAGDKQLYQEVSKLIPPDLISEYREPWGDG